MRNADMILRSDNIFTGRDHSCIAGFVALSGNQILAVGAGGGTEYMNEDTVVYELGNQVICPGFVDVHCFFTGWLLTTAGPDLQACTTESSVLSELSSYSAGLRPGDTLLARGLKPDFTGLTREKLDEVFPDHPVILFYENGESCYMNSSAEEVYQFTPETCWSESYWRLLRYLLNKREFSVPGFKNYMNMMNSRGITSVKEMGFDDFYGFTDVLKELEEQDELTLRVHFMSQPVGAPMDLEHGRRMRSHFHSPFLRFSGYNQMTDGSISQLEGEMKEPYLHTDTCCKKDIDWETLKADAIAADAEDFRFSLHAQGDGAIGKTVDIFSLCKKDEKGRLVNRHAITDLECSDPADLERMGQLGIIAEVYPQIMSLADRESKVSMISETIGSARGKNYWNRRKMADSGIVISCGTDLPLLYDDIPESVYHSTGARFPEGGEPFNPENALSPGELLEAWTRGGQYNLGQEEMLGTLEAGKTADIAVLDGDLFHTPLEKIRDISVSMTIVDGRIVYKK